jgi:hypothetical protein
MILSRSIQMSAAIVTMTTMLLTSVSVSADAKVQSVTIIALNCARDGQAIPVLRIDGNGQTNLQPQGRSVSPGASRFDASLPPGRYFAIVGTNLPRSDKYQPFCRGISQFTVLEGHDRHLVLNMLPDAMILDSGDCWIAGTLPVDGLEVALIHKDGTETPAAVDDGAYYVDNLFSRKYTLRLSLSAVGSKPLDFVVDLSDPNSPNGRPLCTGQNAVRNRIRNITLPELLQLSTAANG